MRWLRVIGVLMLLASVICFWQSRSKIPVYEEAYRKANVMFVSSPESRQQKEALRAREAKYRSLAGKWFLSGGAILIIGCGLVVVPWWLARRRKTAPSVG